MPDFHGQLRRMPHNWPISSVWRLLGGVMGSLRRASHALDAAQRAPAQVSRVVNPTAANIRGFWPSLTPPGQLKTLLALSNLWMACREIAGDEVMNPCAERKVRQSGDETRWACSGSGAWRREIASKTSPSTRRKT